MPSRWTSCLIGGMALAATASADHLIHDRTLDSPGNAQGSPSTAVTYHAVAGRQLVTVWEQQMSTTRELNVSIAALPLGSGTIADHNAPPAPAGFLWFGDPIVRAPDASVSTDGTFYLFAQVRSTGVSPFTFGLGFLRGRAGPGASVTWETPQVIETFGTHTLNQRYINALSMDVQPGTTVVQIGYINTRPNFSTPKVPWHRSSDDGGVTWGTPEPAVSDSTTPTSLVGVQCGPGAMDVSYFLRRQVGLANTMLRRRSMDAGANLGPNETIRSFANTNQWGPHLSTPGPILASEIDRTGAPGAPEMFVLGAEEMDQASLSFPDPTTAPSRVEVEPNGSAAAATLVAAPGTVLRGMVTSGAPPDTDYFAFDLAAETAVTILADSMNANALIICAWVGPDGRSTLTGQFASNSSPGRMAFVAPIAGRFYLRVNWNGGVASYGYRIRTMTGTPPASGARDQRDVFLSSVLPSMPWSSPVDASAGSGAGVGFEESGVSLASNRDGYLYAGWFDWQAQPGAEIARRVMARSPDAGQTWEPARVLSAASSNWLAALGTTAPTLSGPWCATATDGTDIHDVWVDVRNGDPDLYGTTIRRALAITDILPSMIEAQPGQVVEIDVVTRNLDDVFGWDVRVTADTPRGWPLPISNAMLAAGHTLPLPYTFTVPDSAALGTATVFLRVASHLPPYTTYASGALTIEVGTTTEAVDSPARLSLAPVTPNPASRSARIAFSLTRAGRARLAVHAIDGRCVRTLADGAFPAGRHDRGWDGRDEAGRPAAAGAFFVRLEAEGTALVRRMVWLR